MENVASSISVSFAYRCRRAPTFFFLLFALLQLLPSTVFGELIQKGSCTGILRVCKDGEASYRGKTKICNENKLERRTVFLTGGAWWSSVYNLWIAQVLLEEQLQVPVRLVNANGGSFRYYSFDDRTLDILDRRTYSWDALDIASSQNGSMDCAPGFLTTQPTPVDLEKNCKGASCKPCAHAMLEVWPNGQEENFHKYAVERQTIVSGGSLGILGEFGWWATKSVLDSPSVPDGNGTAISGGLLSSYRGLADEDVAAVFKQPLSFGEYCNHTYSDWAWVLMSNSRNAFNVSLPSHFCSYFFTFTMQDQYNMAFSKVRGTEQYLILRDEQVVACRDRDPKGAIADYSFFHLCKRHWILEDDLRRYLPDARSGLKRNGYTDQDPRWAQGYPFLYAGFFKKSEAGGGTLQTTSCPGSELMYTSPGAASWTNWKEDSYGRAGFTRWKNYDPDIISSHDLQLRPISMHHEIKDALEVSGRLLQDKKKGKSPVLISWWRPSEIFKRHEYKLGIKLEVKNPDLNYTLYGGSDFELSKIQLPGHYSECENHRRSYVMRCAQETPSNVKDFEQCGYSTEILYKALSSKLSDYAPEANYVLQRFKMTTEDQEKILASIEYDAKYSTKIVDGVEEEIYRSARSRNVVCDWIKNNTHIWNSWLPSTATETKRCLGEITPILQEDKTTRIFCSGHGVCDDGRSNLSTVVSEFPNAGVCVCDQGYQGDDCSGLVEPLVLNVQLDDVAFYILISLAGLTWFYMLRGVYTVYRYRKKSCVFKTANPTYCFILLGAVQLSLVDIVLWVGPITVAHCILRPVLLALPNIMVVGSIFVKVFRKRMKRAMNTEDINQTVKAMVGLEAMLFTVWFAAFPPTPQKVRLGSRPDLPARVWESFHECEYGETLAAFDALIFTFAAIVLAGTVYTAWDVRLKPTYFNEGRDVLHASIMLLCVNTLGYTAAHFVVAPEMLANFLIISLSILVSCWIVLFRLIRPKLIVHYERPDINNKKAGLFRPLGDNVDAMHDDPSLEIPGLDDIPLHAMTPKERRASRRYRSSFKGGQQVHIDAPSSGQGGEESVALIAGQQGGDLSPVSIGSPASSPQRRHSRASSPPRLASTSSLSPPSSPMAKAATFSLDTAKPLENPAGARSLAYRTPAMHALIEKKYMNSKKVNEQLIKILEEHHIDPESGEMDDDYTALLNTMEEKQLQEIALMDEMYSVKIDELEISHEERTVAMHTQHEHERTQLMESKREAVSAIKAKMREGKKEIKRLQRESEGLKRSLRGSLPEIGVFLAEHKLAVYKEKLLNLGVNSVQELLSLPRLSLETLLSNAGMKRGHQRKLQAALQGFEGAVILREVPVERASVNPPVALIQDGPADDNGRVAVQQQREGDETVGGAEEESALGVPLLLDRDEIEREGAVSVGEGSAAIAALDCGKSTPAPPVHVSSPVGTSAKRRWRTGLDPTSGRRYYYCT